MESTGFAGFLGLDLFALFNCAASEPARVIELWPEGAPGEKGDIGPERDTTKPTNQLIAGKPVIRLGNVSNPTISIYRPAVEKQTGAAVLVCPGGGYHILAMDLEGTEVCEWLNSIGVTSVLLNSTYRAPARFSMSAIFTSAPPWRLLSSAASMKARISMVSSGGTGAMPVRKNFTASATSGW